MLAAVYYGPNNVKLEDREVPELSEGDILIRVKATGFCSSDVRTIKFGSHSVIPPRILGHEFSGIVEDVKGSVEGLSIGDYVNVAPDLYCGRCSYCIRGHENLCPNTLTLGYNIDGAYAEFVRVPADFIRRGLVFKVPKDIPPEYAALIEPLATIVEAHRKLGEHVGRKMVIVGDGPMGLMHGLVGKAMGAEIIVSGMVNHRLKVARELGFITINASEEDPIKRVHELTNNYGADFVIIAVSNEKAIMQGIEMAAKGSKVLIFAGLPKGRLINLNPNRIHYDEVTLMGSFSYKYSSYYYAYRLVVEKKINLRPIITHRFPLDKFFEAFEAASNYLGLKVVIVQ